MSSSASGGPNRSSGALAAVTPAWRVVGKTVRGASHARTDLPNQDAIGWRPPSGAGLPLMLAVSDGHGSQKSFRSDRGSKFAVDAVLEECESLLEGRQPLSAIKRMADSHLPQLLVRRWRDSVLADLDKEPLSTVELDKLEKTQGAAVRKKIEDPEGEAKFVVYGATVLAAVVAESFILYLQLGDGDIITVDEEGERRRPMPHDERLMANETTSLCSKNAERECRVVFHPLSEQSPPPALILVSTDGYANSFRDEKGFLQVGSDILEMICDDGLDKVGGEMEAWLADASKVGSGDDITLGLLCREPALPSVREKMAARRQGEAAEAAEAKKPGEPDQSGEPDKSSDNEKPDKAPDNGSGDRST